MLAFFIMGVALAAQTQPTVNLDLEASTRALVQDRLQGQLAGSGVNVHITHGRCPDDAATLCVRADGDALVWGRGPAERRFEGPPSARAEALALSLASLLKARAAAAEAAPEPPSAASTTTAPPRYGRHEIGAAGGVAQDGIGWYPRLELAWSYGDPWLVGVDVGVGGRAHDEAAGLQLDVLRFGAGLHGAYRWAGPNWTWALGIRLGAAFTHRSTRADGAPEPGAPRVEPAAGQLYASPAFGPLLRIGWRPHRNWTLDFRARVDLVPLRVNLDLDTPSGPERLASTGLVQPTFGLGVRWVGFSGGG